ncbi:hypothetical protein PYCCODRAFT_1440711 [Trametes coccinea BRFM310]|uniref:Uncharacterized protein n=1 Tax=Trametes coccinea (strain BRFM310) TaxID=1353009 RepID=A0A1Y2I6W8_TRAC3|nr:hypothetical protein PYCCODRAFT_1440711 [Trametes coccinea BRFM310]
MRPFALGLRSTILRTSGTSRLLPFQRRALQLGQGNTDGVHGDEPQLEYEEMPTVNLSLRTLSPERLSPEDYIDLSDSRVLVKDYMTPSNVNDSDNAQLPPYIYYGRRYFVPSQRRFSPFPVNARGFFYYHPHYLFSYGGSIRFRVAQDPDPKLFNHGQDLLTEYGTPWQIPLLALGHLPRLPLLKSVLERDGLVSSTFWKNAHVVEQAKELRILAHSQVIYRCGEPFYVNLATPNHAIYIATPTTIYALTSRRLFLTDIGLIQQGRWSVPEWAQQYWPFKKGMLICRLEHIRGRSGVTARVVRIVEPVQMAMPFTKDVPTVDLPLLPRERITVKNRWSHSLLANPNEREELVLNHLIRVSTATRKNLTPKQLEKLMQKWTPKLAR